MTTVLERTESSFITHSQFKPLPSCCDERTDMATSLPETMRAARLTKVCKTSTSSSNIQILTDL